MKTVKIERGRAEILSFLPVIADHGWIAGGFARWCASPREEPEIPGDVDVWCRTIASLGSLREAFAQVGSKIRDTPMSEEWELELPACLPHILLRKVQLIQPLDIGGNRKTYGELEDLIEGFDLTVTIAGVLDFETALVHDDFEEDEFNKRIRFANIESPVGSMLRAVKYARKGYRIRATEALLLFEEWSKRGPEYQAELSSLLAVEDPSPEQIDELEWLLR